MPDGLTPYDCNKPVMVGVELPIVVISDSNDFWSGGLFIEDQNRTTGYLEARGHDPNRLLYDPNRSQYGVTPYIGDFKGSHLSNTGKSARVTSWEDSLIQGFDLYTTEINDSNFAPGQWFVIDYTAGEVGDCNIGLYDYSLSWTEPQQYIKIKNVSSRNFDQDPNHNVNFSDFAVFSSKWLAIDCNEPNFCEGIDLNQDSAVDYNDLGLFVSYWLWNDTSDYNRPQKPSDTTYVGDPNIIYSIVDINGVNEITLDVNESIRIYIDLATYNDGNVYAFDIEADISNTSLGSIDNTEHPSGTAMLHAGPGRITIWDYWGPGIQQQEGIKFVGHTNGGPIDDGHLASFVYSPLGQGDVVLNLVNWVSVNTLDEDVFPTLESIIIHQVDTSVQQMSSSTSTTTETSESQEPTQQETADEVADWYEDLWPQEKEIRETYTKKEWDEFVDSIRDSD
jgi:hypothetical protein